jgi:hypothetical protein
MTQTRKGRVDRFVVRAGGTDDLDDDVRLKQVVRD